MLISGIFLYQKGDPLSPYLFLICDEGLSTLMRLAKNEKRIKGFKASISGLEITHLLFANDYILFGKASKRGASELKNILQVSEQNSSQSISLDRSTVFFSSNSLM